MTTNEVPSLSNILSCQCSAVDVDEEIVSLPDENNSVMEQEIPTNIKKASRLRTTSEGSTSSLVRSRSTEQLDETKQSLDHVEDEGCYEDSERLESPAKGHRRAVSDPSCCDDDVFKDALDEIVHEEQNQALGTLPRYPVAVTGNKNCYSEPPVSIFNVRGPEYFANKKKVESGPYLMQARGCDLFHFDEDDKEAASDPNIVQAR